MRFPVIKGAAYALIHANDMVLHQGSTQTSEARLNPGSEYLKALPAHLRSFQEVVAYPPNQVYIGNLRPAALKAIPRPWRENPVSGAGREGKFGEIMPLDEFYGLVKAADMFDLVLMEGNYQKATAAKLATHSAVADWKTLAALEKGYAPPERIRELVAGGQAEPMYLAGQLIGCVRKAHDFDAALSEHVMFENLVSKASAAFCLSLLLRKTGLPATAVEYIIECSEEACGDMNQRGGGNFAKAIGELCGCVNATGSDTRGFCAGPVHALVEAAALVRAGVYRDVVVVAGGASAKLGMNGKDHVRKGLPILEDTLGAFAVHIGADDGLSPILRIDIVGRHRIGSGAAPQAVMRAIVTDPLDQGGIPLADVDCFSAELQNPEITEPAGAGDVPLSNYKMIAALGVTRKDFAREDLAKVVERIGMPGFAPTQGHIPSGVPFLGHCREMMLEGLLRRVMVIGKGSLFLGRLTNLFDGVSLVVEKNPGGGPEDQARVGRTRVGLTLAGSEHGEAEMLRGALLAQERDPAVEVVAIGRAAPPGLALVEAADAEAAREKMESMLASGELDAAVTMHYSFPIGVSTVGRVIAPALGRGMYIANTTGASDTSRIRAMLKNAITAIAVAKACGNETPSVGILNVEGARQVERALTDLRDHGYPIRFAASGRADGGAVMRGNDLLRGGPDIMVTDSLTGNVIVKLLSAFTAGGDRETLGDGYGPGAGEGCERIINIISRASGAPVVAGALSYAGACARGDLPGRVAGEFALARKAGLDKALAELAGPVGPAAPAGPAELAGPAGSVGPAGASAPSEPAELAGPAGASAPPGPAGAGALAAPAQAAGGERKEQTATPPPPKAVSEELTGVDILVLEDAERALWRAGIYATAGMGCTGPVILVAAADKEKAIAALKTARFL
ncbi:MAG: DUF5940 domain-containing protein [Peptococcaceae bacterium]|jgi:betaine reductase|nr:DUF5940 domain-containing protein [Peptococcaceae bacterium]